MTLDKQQILNELGNVVNQLQGADCGCMGKIFTNSPNQNNSGNPPCHGGGGYGSCGHHCCGHHHHQGWGQNAPCGGEPHSNQPCMTACNPQKLYADTYRYLNHNLMQPALKEMYHDLKTITPANTIANNPMASKLGIAAIAPPDVTANMAQNQMAGGEMNNAMAHNQMNNGMDNMPQNQMTSGGMGYMPQNQMTSGGIGNMPQNQTTGDALDNMFYNQMAGGGMSHNNAQNQRTSGGMSNTPQNQITSDGLGNMFYNQMTGGGMSQKMPQNQMTSGGISNMPQNQMINSGMSNMPQNQMTSGGNNMSYNQANAGGMGSMASQNQMYGSSGGGIYGNAQGATIAGNMSQNMNPNQQQQIAPQHNNQQKLGHQGVGMFNAMFPGVMQGLGGDLDFDPMSIAVQMNPSNQQRVALDGMKKMMMSNNEGIGKIVNDTGDSAAMQPAIKRANAAAYLGQDQPTRMQQNATAYQAVPIQQNATAAYQPMQQNAPASYQPMQQNAPTGYQQMQQNVPTGYQQMQQNAPTGYQPAQPQQNITGYDQMTPTHDQGPTYQSQYRPTPTMGNAPPQPVYAAYTGAPMMNQQEISKDVNQLQYQQMDPNAGRDPAYEGSGDPNAQRLQYQQQYKEPIFPAQSNRQPHYSAQQVKQLPAMRMYQPPEQQMVPTQRVPTRMNEPPAYSNVKATISKTSLMGFKRSGNVPSRGQLQQIYNQYKGSQSYTQQNVRPSDRNSHSAGNLNVNQARPVPVPVQVERLGGDTIHNQMDSQYANKGDHEIGRMGDVPANNKPMGDFIKEEPPTRQSRCRNGLQDVVFTSYPSSAAWSFHGNRYKA